MMGNDDIDKADRLSRRRARALPILAMVFILQQASYFSSVIEGARSVDHVRIGAWLILTLVILLVLTTGGFWFSRPAVRALVDDEVTRSNRHDAMRIGFIASVLGGLAVYVLTFFEPIGAREAVHLLITVGMAAALLRFGYLERRAHRSG
ncbi:MAG TPA: hypothetical protein VGB08_07540 [Allosphingosinicella sp.]|jgi:hypothetical protein